MKKRSKIYSRILDKEKKAECIFCTVGVEKKVILQVSLIFVLYFISRDDKYSEYKIINVLKTSRQERARGCFHRQAVESKGREGRPLLVAVETPI